MEIVVRILGRASQIIQLMVMVAALTLAMSPSQAYAHDGGDLFATSPKTPCHDCGEITPDRSGQNPDAIQPRADHCEHFFGPQAASMAAVAWSMTTGEHHERNRPQHDAQPDLPPPRPRT